MPRETIPCPICAECRHYLRFSESLPKKQHGVMMRSGDRFCLGSKKARRFGKNDPKLYVPSWCPKRKTPCELRVYGFKNPGEAAMHSSLSLSLGSAISPEGRRYAVEFERTVNFTPREFWNDCQSKSDTKLLGFPVLQYHVVEVDDGLRPVCFYKVDGGYRIARFFDTARARTNKMEGDADERNDL